MMPIYPYRCSECGAEIEVLQAIGVMTRECACGADMERTPTFIAMVKMKGEGGFPSRRKFVKGSSPFTTRGTKAWGEYDHHDFDSTGRRVEPAPMRP